MDNDVAKIYLIFWCPPDTAPDFETSYLEDYGKVFATEVRIPGFDYVGRGVSSTKEGSKNNASVHYLMHLIRDGLLDKERVAKRVPCLPLGVYPDGSFDPLPLPNFLEPITDDSFGKHDFSSQQDNVFSQEPQSSRSEPHRRRNFNSEHELAIDHLNPVSEQNLDYRIMGSSQEHVPLQVLVPQQAINDVLGLDGSTVRHIETRTGAKIMFPEKGEDDSMEVKNNNNGNIFTVIGESDKVQAAAYIINKIVQYALVKAANSLSQSFAVANNREQTSSEMHSQDLKAIIDSKDIQSKQILVPQKAVGLVIGKEGNIIKSIEKDFGVLIKFINNSKDAPPGDKYCTVTGTLQQIHNAFNKINAIIQHVQKTGSTLPSQQIFGSVSATLTKGSSKKEILVPSDKVGYVVGATLKRIQKETGTRIRFGSKKKNKVDGRAMKLQISGPPDKVEIAANEIKGIIEIGMHTTKDASHVSQEDKESVSVTNIKDLSSELKTESDSSKSQENKDSGTVTGTKGSPVEEVLIPEEAFEFVMGKNNATIDHVSKCTGAKIIIPTRKISDYSGVRKVLLEGKPDDVKNAAKRINALINIAVQNIKNIEAVEGIAQHIPGSSRLEVLVPEEVATCVSGKDGATIKRISADTGANIVLQQNMIDDKLGIRKCIITGAPDAVSIAARRINALINIGVVRQATTPYTPQQIQQPIDVSNTFGYPSLQAQQATIQHNQYPPPLQAQQATIQHNQYPPPLQAQQATIQPAPQHNQFPYPPPLQAQQATIQPGLQHNQFPYPPPLQAQQATIQPALQHNQFPYPPPLQAQQATIQPALQHNQFPYPPPLQAQQATIQHNQYPPPLQAQQATIQHNQCPPPLQTNNTNVQPPLQKNLDRMSVIGALEKQLSKKNVHLTSQQNQDSVAVRISRDSSLKLEKKKALHKPQKNWYRMAISDSHSSYVPQSSKGYEFILEPSLERKINIILAAVKINPMIIPQNMDSNFPLSLKLKQNISTGRINISSQPDIIMRWWSPPQKNWDPWLNCNIDEPPLSEMPLEQIGSQLMVAHFSQIQNDENLQKYIKERKQAGIRSQRHEILHTIKNNSVTIIHGPSGAGKTTQLPQYILDSYLNLEHGAECCILVAQPRCINAMATAKRIAKERSEDLSNSVGYEVPFQSCFPRPYGCILFCTIDILLKRLEAGIRGVSHIILDDVHEKNAKSDFIMAVLRDMVKAFPHLRVILLSASLDITSLKVYFPGCAVIEVPLATHSVRDYYLEDMIPMLGFVPPPKESRKEIEYSDHLDNKEDIKSFDYASYGLDNITVEGVSFDLIVAILAYIKSMNVSGAILIFLPDCNTISALMAHLQNHSEFGNSSYLCLSLHSEISPEEMEYVFQPVPPGITKIVLSNNIAETAVTLKDVVYVIDSCKTVIKRYTSYNTAINYTTVWAAKHNLELRSRQASFVQSGYCFRLCSRECFAKLKYDITPEIQYTALYELILSIKLLRLGNSKQFLLKTLKPPSSKAILDAEEFLADLGAIDKSGNLTSLGKMLARLPVEPRLGKMIILSCLFLLGDVCCLLAAYNSIHPESSAPNLEKFVGYRCSDHVAFLNAFTQWENIQAEDKEAGKEFCEQNGLSSHLMNLAYDGKKQLKEIVHSMGFPESCLEQRQLFLNVHDSDVNMVIALLVMGLHPNICFHKESRKVNTFRTNLATSFNAPFFVFGRKICTREATYKDMTMISVAHLLLFGNNHVQLIRGLVHIDLWISLKMDPKTVSKIVAVRTALEVLINDIVANPKSILSLDMMSIQLISLVKVLCNEMDDEYGATDYCDTMSFSSPQVEPPQKRRLLSAEQQNNNDIQRRQNQFDSYDNSNIGYSLDNSPLGNVDSNAFGYSNIVESRNASTERYTSDNKYFERRVAAEKVQEFEDSGFRSARNESDRFERDYATRDTLRRKNSRFGVVKNNDNHFQSHSSARNRKRTMNESSSWTSARSDFGSLARGMKGDDMHSFT